MVLPFVYTEEEYKKLEQENEFLKAEIELLKKPRFSDRYLKKLEEENQKLKERIKELEKEIEELNKMMLFETELEK